MSKNSRILVILGIIIAVLAAGTVVLMSVGGKEDRTKQHTEEKKESFYVYKEDENNISKIVITAPDGTLSAQNSEGIRTVNDYELTETDTSKLDFLFSAAANIISENKIEDDPGDLSEYGLNDPRITVEITLNDGTKDTMLIGDLSPTIGEYFITSDKDGAVYTVSVQKVETFKKTLDYYISFDRFLVNIDDITGITIERGGEIIDLNIAEDILNTTNDVWEMRTPFETTANDEYIDDTILASVEAIELSEPLNDGGAHGTDAPTARLVLTIRPFDNASGEYAREYTEELLIGNSAEGETFVGYKGNVFSVSSALLEFINTRAFNMVNKLQAMVSVNNIKSLEISYGEETHRIDVAQGKSVTDVDFSLDGKSVDNRLAKKLYQAVIGLAVDDIYAGEPLGNTVLTFKYTGIDGHDDVLAEFKAINALSCALVKNSKAEFTIKQNKLEDFISVFNAYVQNPNG